MAGLFVSRWFPVPGGGRAPALPFPPGREERNSSLQHDLSALGAENILSLLFSNPPNE